MRTEGISKQFANSSLHTTIKVLPQLKIKLNHFNFLPEGFEIMIKYMCNHVAFDS